jgi:hypothetical protein
VAERGQGQIFYIIVGMILMAVLITFGVCKLIIPGDGNDHSLGRVELTARSHDRDGDNDDEGDGEANYFSPKIEKLIICLPGSTCPQT